MRISNFSGHADGDFVWQQTTGPDAEVFDTPRKGLLKPPVRQPKVRPGYGFADVDMQAGLQEPIHVELQLTRIVGECKVRPTCVRRYSGP